MVFTLSLSFRIMRYLEIEVRHGKFIKFMKTTFTRETRIIDLSRQEYIQLLSVLPELISGDQNEKKYHVKLKFFDKSDFY